MVDWKDYRLEQITEPVKDTYNPTGNDDHSYIGLEHIIQEALRFNSVGHSTDVSSNKFIFKKSDVLFGKLRPYFRKVVKPNFSGICSTDIWVFRAKDGFLQDFLFYFLANWDFVDTASGGEGGTRMPRADWKFLSQTKWSLPPLPEQKAIATVLSSLDDKIDLLHRQNKTLETMAETLFRQWFIEEAQDDWQSAQLRQFVEVERGLSYKGAGLCMKGIGVPMHNLNSVYEGGGYKYDGIKYYSGDYKDRHLIKPGDIIITNTEQGHDLLLIGFPAIIPKFFGEVGIFSQHLYKLIIKGTYISTAYLYYLLKNHEVRGQIASATNGSTVNMLPRDGIEWVKVKLPPEQKIIKFTTIVEPYLEKQGFIYSQIQTLEKLRDNLLPKLMSGELKVNYE